MMHMMQYLIQLHPKKENEKMEQMQMIMIIGVLKGMQSQVTDMDVQFALGECINIFDKLLQGYQLVKPEPPQTEEEEEA